MIRRHSKGPPYDQPAQRPRADLFPLRGTDGQALKVLRERIKRASGVRRYVYRESRASHHVIIANHEIRDRAHQLVGVYNSSVTAAMLRQDIYGEDPREIKYAEWKGRAA